MPHAFSSLLGPRWQHIQEGSKCRNICPSKSVADLEAKSVIKKWKDKSFATGVNRSVIQKGVDMLGVDLTDLINDAILGMRQVSRNYHLL